MPIVLSIIAIIIALALFRETKTGKVVLTAAVVGIGCKLLAGLTDIEFFSSIASACAVVAIIAIIVRVILFILGDPNIGE